MTFDRRGSFREFLDQAACGDVKWHVAAAAGARIPRSTGLTVAAGTGSDLDGCSATVEPAADPVRASRVRGSDLDGCSATVELRPSAGTPGS